MIFAASCNPLLAAPAHPQINVWNFVIYYEKYKFHYLNNVLYYTIRSLFIYLYLFHIFILFSMVLQPHRSCRSVGTIFHPFNQLITRAAPSVRPALLLYTYILHDFIQIQPFFGRIQFKTYFSQWLFVIFCHITKPTESFYTIYL